MVPLRPYGAIRRMAYKRFGRHRMAFKISQAIRTQTRMGLPQAATCRPADPALLGFPGTGRARRAAGSSTGRGDGLGGMREFVDTRELPKSLYPLRDLLKTFIVSTGEVERSFNQMNLICDDTRTRLTCKNLSSLMFLNINGPELCDLKIQTYAKTWLIDHVSATNLKARKRKGREGTKYSFQKWF